VPTFSQLRAKKNVFSTALRKDEDVVTTEVRRENKNSIQPWSSSTSFSLGCHSAADARTVMISVGRVVRTMYLAWLFEGLMMDNKLCLQVSIRSIFPLDARVSRCIRYSFAHEFSSWIFAEGTNSWAAGSVTTWEQIQCLCD
jgi:hypothetical protein